MFKKLKKALIISIIGISLCLSAFSIGLIVYKVNAKYNENTTDITITKNVDLHTFRNGKYSAFADPWGDYYSGGVLQGVTGWLFESSQNNAPITLFDEVVGNFSIVMQPLQEKHNGSYNVDGSGKTLNWDFMQFVFTDKADPNNVLSVDLYESGWYTYNIELHYKGSTHFAYNHGGESFGGVGNYSRQNYVMKISFDEIINTYYDDFTYKIKGFNRYSVSMALGVKNYGDQRNKTLMVYELCGQKLNGDPLVDTAAPQFKYSPVNGVLGKNYTVAPADGAFDVIDGLINAEKFTYVVSDSNGNVVQLNNNTFTPNKSGNYKVTVSVKDSANNTTSKDYEFEIFSKHPSAAFNFDSSYEVEYATDTPFTLIKPVSVISALTGKEIGYTVSLYSGSEKIKQFSSNEPFVSITLNRMGQYKVVYETEEELGNTSEYVCTFSVVLKPYIPELSDETISLGSVYEISNINAVYNGQTKPLSATVVGPDGNDVTVDKNGKFVANKLGQYVVRFSTQFGDVVAETTQIVESKILASGSFIKTNSINEIRLNRDTTMYSQAGNGMEVVTSAGGVLSTIPFDLSLVNTTKLLSLNAAHYDDVGKMQQIILSLVDATDPSNSISMRIWQSPWSFEVIYITYEYRTKNGDILWCTPEANFWSEKYGTSYIGREVGTSIGTYEGYVKYGKSLIGGLKNMSFINFEFDYKTGTFFMDGTPLFSISDPACVGPSRIWSGFATNHAYMTVTVDIAPTTCAYNIVEFLGQSLSGDMVDDKTAPYIVIEESDYFDGEDLPKAEVGKKYTIPSYYAVDYFAGVASKKVRVMDPTGSAVSIRNGAFTPSNAGTYYVLYEATDMLGNKREKLLELTVLESGNYFDWQFENVETVTGETLVIPEVNVSSDISKLIVEEKITYAGQSIDTALRTVKLMALSDVIITVSATDYLGNVEEKVYTIKVNASELPVLDIESGMPISVRKGMSLTVPSFNAYDFNYDQSSSEFYPEKWIEVNGHKIDSLSFNVNDNLIRNNELRIVYCAGNGSKVARSEEFIVPVINPEYIGDWIIANNDVTVDYQRTFTRFIVSGDTTLQVANALAVSGLQFKFGAEPNNAPESISIRLVDYMDEYVSLLFTVTPLNNNFSYLSINGSEEKFVIPGSFTNEQEIFLIYYNNESKILTDVYGNLICEIKTTERGASFKGFDSGAVRMSLNVVAGDDSAAIRLFQISNQLIISKFKSGSPIAYADTTAPVLQLDSAMRNIKLAKGEVFEIPSAKAYDFCSGKATVTRTMTSPSKNQIFTNASCDSSFSYKFDEYGIYDLVYTMTDNGKQYTKVFRIEVVDDTLPIITVEKTADITVKAGESFIVPSATVTDNVSEVRLYIFIVDDWNLKSVNANSEISISEKGEYYLRYYAVDENYNTAEIIVKIHVV